MAEGVRSLRDELGGRPDPEFELSLPEGWVRRAPSDASREEFEQALKRRLMAANRPDIMAHARPMLRQAFADMQKNRVVAMFAPFNDEERGLLPVPASMLATVRASPSREPLDDYVRRLIVKEKAQPLFDDKRTLRYESESLRDEEGTQIVLSTTTYVTPIPGTRRRRALELVASYGRLAETPRDDEMIVNVHSLFDLVASTLRWVPSSTA